MKIRQGFVSNSSSSSFVIIAKPGIYSIEEEVKKAIITESNNFWYELSKEAAKILWNNANEITLQEIYENSDGHHELVNEKEMEYLRNGGNLFEGVISDEDGAIEAMLCGIGINYENNRIIIYKDKEY